MIPDVPTVLGGIARSVALDLAPEIRSAYGNLTVQLMSALLLMIAQEFDRAAARLAEENDALRALFDEAQDTVTDEVLRADLRQAAAPAANPSLVVSQLRARNRELRAVLVRLHAHVETLDSPAGRALDERVWAELIASTRRRQLDLAIG